MNLNNRVNLEYCKRMTSLNQFRVFDERAQLNTRIRVRELPKASNGKLNPEQTTTPRTDCKQ